jgi:hypothetical protein
MKDPSYIIWLYETAKKPIDEALYKEARLLFDGKISNFTKRYAKDARENLTRILDEDYGTDDEDHDYSSYVEPPMDDDMPDHRNPFYDELEP